MWLRGGLIRLRYEVNPSRGPVLWQIGKTLISHLLDGVKYWDCQFQVKRRNIIQCQSLYARRLPASLNISKCEWQA